MSNVHYVSVNSKPDHPPGDVFERANSPPFGHKESAKPRPLWLKNRAKTPPPWQFFSKIRQKKPTKNEIEIMKNSTEILTGLEIPDDPKKVLLFDQA